MLQNGHEENLKKVRITLLPFMEDISNVEPSMAGSEISGAGSPFLSLVMRPGRKYGVKNAPMMVLLRVTWLLYDVSIIEGLLSDLINDEYS